MYTFLQLPDSACRKDSSPLNNMGVRGIDAPSPAVENPCITFDSFKTQLLIDYCCLEALPIT